MNLRQALAKAPDGWQRQRLLRKWWARTLGASNNNHNNRIPPDLVPKRELWPGKWWWQWSYPRQNYHLIYATEQPYTWHLHDYKRSRTPTTRDVEHYFLSDFGYWASANRSFERKLFFVAEEQCPNAVLVWGGVLTAYFKDPSKARTDIPHEFYGYTVMIKPWRPWRESQSG